MIRVIEPVNVTVSFVGMYMYLDIDVYITIASIHATCEVLQQNKFERRAWQSTKFGRGVIERLLLQL